MRWRLDPYRVAGLGGGVLLCVVAWAAIAFAGLSGTS